jgi:hydroxymethylbilane synthase
MNHTSNRTLAMGTRGSPLALAQSRQVARALEAAHSGLHVEERIIRTTGDKQQGQPLPAIGGKGVFTLEIEAALLGRDIDFAVHSLKDLPPQLPEGLCIAAIPQRASAHDVCVLHPTLRRSLPAELTEDGGGAWSFLPHGARVGTSSLRRRAQLLHHRPDLNVQDIRGNIDTRLRKLESEGFEAIVLAAAGLERLELNASGEYSPLFVLEGEAFIAAPGQGALAIEARSGDSAILQILGALEHGGTRVEIEAERAVMRALNAGCSTPLGARAVVNLDSDSVALQAVVLTPSGEERFLVTTSGHLEEAEALGASVAAELLKSGADAVLSTRS